MKKKKCGKKLVMRLFEKDRAIISLDKYFEGDNSYYARYNSRLRNFQERTEIDFSGSVIYKKLNNNLNNHEILQELATGSFRFYKRNNELLSFLSHVFESGKYTRLEIEYLEIIGGRFSGSFASHYVSFVVNNYQKSDVTNLWDEESYIFLLVTLGYMWGYGFMSDIPPDSMNRKAITSLFISETDESRFQYLLSLSESFNARSFKSDGIDIDAVMLGASKKLNKNNTNLESPALVCNTVKEKGLDFLTRNKILEYLGDDKLTFSQIREITPDLIATKINTEELLKLSSDQFGHKIYFHAAIIMNKRFIAPLKKLPEISKDVLKELSMLASYEAHEDKIDGVSRQAYHGNKINSEVETPDFYSALFLSITYDRLDFANMLLESEGPREVGINYKRKFRLNKTTNRSLFSGPGLSNSPFNDFNGLLSSCDRSSARAQFRVSSPQKGVCTFLNRLVIGIYDKELKGKVTISYDGSKYSADIDELFCNHILSNVEINGHRFDHTGSSQGWAISHINQALDFIYLNRK